MDTHVYTESRHDSFSAHNVDSKPTLAPLISK